MPKQYSPDRKADALEKLQANGGAVPTTAAQTGISERTLYLWRKELWLLQSLQRKPLETPPQKDIPEFEDDLQALLHLRLQALYRSRRLAIEVNENLLMRLNTIWLFDRLRALIRLVDLFLKLSGYLKPYLDEQAQDEQNEDAYTPSSNILLTLPQYNFVDEYEDEQNFGYGAYPQ